MASKGFVYIWLTMVLAMLLPTAACACPLIGELIDFNCDGHVRILVIGDSIVIGEGDTRNGGRGGYVLRLQRRFPEARVLTYAIDGGKSGQIYSYLRYGFTKNQGFARQLRALKPDLFIVAAGINDWWPDHSPGPTVRYLARIVDLLRTELRDGKQEPLAAIATLPPNHRGGQNTFASGVNALLLRYRSHSLPTRVRFDRLDPSLIGPDKLHPSSAGYDRLGRILGDYVGGGAQHQMAKARPDRDEDGIYDCFENRKFDTDPILPDTDADGYLDGQEVFELDSDPLDPLDPGQGEASF